MTNDIILGIDKRSSENDRLGKQIKMKQLTVSQNQIKAEFVKIAKEEFNTTIGSLNSRKSPEDSGRVLEVAYDF